MLQIQLIAQAAEERYIAPGCQRGDPEGLGMGCCGNVGTEGGLGIQIA